MISEGANGGVQGILALQGDSGVKFVGYALGWKSDLNVKLFDDAGRGDDLWGNFLALSSGGDISLQGDTRLDGQPIPSSYKGERGNLILTQTTGVSATYPVMVVASSFVKKDREQGLWKFTHVCKIVGAPTFAGWTGTNAAGIDAFDDKELWAGLTKLVDPNGLLSGATQRWRVFGLDDDDATEKAKIDDVLATIAAPYPTMKIKTGAFNRLSTSVCLVDVRWSLTNSSEDVINPRTETTIDDKSLTSHATSAAINDATPPNPTGDNFVLREISSNELNDQNTLYVASYGKRNTQQDVEFPGSIPRDDPYDLEDEANVTKVTASSTPPSVPSAPVGQHVKTISEQLTADNKWKHTFEYSNNNSVQRVEFSGSGTEDDPSDLADEYRKTIVGDTSTPPATPTPDPSDLKLRRRVSRRIGGTPEKWSHLFEFARRTQKDDQEMSNSGSQGTPFEGIVTRVATVIDSTDTPAAIAAANFSTAVTFESVSVKTLTDGKALLIQATRDNPRIVMFEMRSPGEEPVRGYVFAGQVYLYVRTIYQRANFWEYELAEQPLPLLRMRFGIRRRQTGEPIDMEWGLADGANDNDFLGLPAGTTAYRGINGQHNYTNGGPAELFHEFEYLLIHVGILNVTGHILFGSANMGWHRTEQDLSGISPGTWVRASDLYELDDAFDSIPYPQVDYSGVLA